MHQARLAGLPNVGALGFQAPLAAASGVRVSGVIRHNGSLHYRADGLHGLHGLARDESGGPRMLLPDTASTRVLGASSSGGWLVARQASARAHPPRVESVLLWSSQAQVRVSGQVAAVAENAPRAVVADALGAAVRLVDLPNGLVTMLAELPHGLDPLLPANVAIHPDGSEVLFTLPTNARGGVSLQRIRLDTMERSTLLPAADGPSRILCCYAPDGRRVVASEMVLGETPRFRLWDLVNGRSPRVVTELHHSQPAVAPVFVDALTLALVLSITTYPGASYGPTDVALVRLDGGTPRAITRAGDVRGELRVEGLNILLEGGRTLGVVTLERP